MEFLFTNQLASLESILLILCILAIIGIYFFDGYKVILQIIGVLTPRKTYIKETREEEPDEEKSALHPETAEIIEKYLAEKNEWETTLEEIRTDSIVEESEKLSTQKEEILLAIDPESPYKELISEHDATLLPEKKEELLLEMQPIEELLEVPEPTLLLSELPEEILLPSSPHTESIETAQEEILLEQTLGNKEIESWNKDEILPEGTKEELLEERNYIAPSDILWEDEKFDIEKIQQKLQSEVDINKKNIILPPVIIEEKRPSSQISPEKREKLTEIVNTVKTLLARGHVIEARGMIVNGLAIQKEHRELNILLAWIYERDRDYTKSEYIFKDLARLYPDDTEILIHLADSLAMQHNYEVSYELYKKILSLGGETEEILYTLSHLSAELSLPEETYNYSRSYIKKYPKNPEILWLFAQSQIALWNRKEAIETLIKLKNLTPYNGEILDLIQKLITEEELAGNFGNQ